MKRLHKPNKLKRKQNGFKRPQVVGQPASQQHFKSGINSISDLLAPTLGPTGGVVVNQSETRSTPELLADSATIVRRILSLGDPRLDVGAMLMRHLIWRIGERIGDGGATTAVLTRAIFNDAHRLITAGVNPMMLSRGIKAATAAVLAALAEQERAVTSEDELAAVALTVTKERPLAAMLGEMSYLLGPDAHVIIEKYVAPYLQRQYHSGAHYKAQIASMYFYTDSTHKVSVLPDTMVALVDDNLQEGAQAVALLEAAVEAGAEGLTVIARTFKTEALSVLVANQQAEDKKLSIVGATLKDVGDERRYAFSDLALLTGATLLGSSYDRGPADVRPDDLGRARRVEVTPKALILLPEKQFDSAVQAQAENLRSLLSQMTQDDEDREMVVKRLAALSGGMGILKIGATGKQERAVRSKTAERALKVLSAAQHSGVVPGGGAAFFHAASALDGLDVDDEIRPGVDVIRRSLSAPLQQILQNCHVESTGVVFEQLRQAGPTSTFDALEGRVVDAYEAGVLDVTRVLEGVLETAVSGALMALTTDTIVYHKKPEQNLNP